MNVAAKDKATSKEQSIRIEASSGLSKEEIDSMVKDADAHAAEDKQQREIVDTRNQADQLIYQTEKSLKEQDDKIEAEDKNKVEAAIGRLKEAVKGDNIDEIKSANDGLNTVWGEIASKLYAQAQQQEAQSEPEAQAQNAETGEEPESDKKVEDADFEVIDDDKDK